MVISNIYIIYIRGIYNNIGTTVVYHFELIPQIPQIPQLDTIGFLIPWSKRRYQYRYRDLYRSGYQVFKVINLPATQHSSQIYKLKQKPTIQCNKYSTWYSSTGINTITIQNYLVCTSMYRV
jgi:hypothetical protein